jgi:hypothetical protein
VFRLLKLLMSLAGLALFIWFGANVSLGRRTLFEHLQAIGHTRETHELLEGTRQSAKPLLDGVRRRLAGGGAADEHPSTAPADGGVAATDQVSETDRKHLRRLLGAKSPH